MRLSDELQVGKAGEYLVCFDLIMKGLVAYPSEQGLPYDIVLDTGDKLLKIQVKTTQQPKTFSPSLKRKRNLNKAYVFNVKRKGKKGKKIYTNDEIDIFALVALDTMKVGYLLNEDMPKTLNLRCEHLRGLYHDEKWLSVYDEVKRLDEQKVSRLQISEKLGLSYYYTCKVLSPSYKPARKGVYLTDLQKPAEWFKQIKSNKGEEA